MMETGGAQTARQEQAGRRRSCTVAFERRQRESSAHVREAWRGPPSNACASEHAQHDLAGAVCMRATVLECGILGCKSRVPVCVVSGKRRVVSICCWGPSRRLVTRLLRDLVYWTLRRCSCQ